MKVLIFFTALLLPTFALAAVGSPYMPSNLGYDVTFSTYAYPAESFGFVVLGVSGGKAFVDNKRLSSGFAWSHFASNTAATIYMNLNAPYGKTVAGHIDSPRTCPPPSPTSTSTEPTVCQGYNYGYQAAEHAYSYAKLKGVESGLWWLDIEVDNSWSKNLSVNDATIQGAIDSLNAKGIRVGIYSLTRMWRVIAGANFVPTQTISGLSLPVPTWFPIGVKSQVGAINTCVAGKSFMSGSPIWIVQYEASSTAIDQNIAC